MKSSSFNRPRKPFCEPTVGLGQEREDILTAGADHFFQKIIRHYRLERLWEKWY